MQAPKVKIHTQNHRPGCVRQNDQYSGLFLTVIALFADIRQRQHGKFASRAQHHRCISKLGCIIGRFVPAESDHIEEYVCHRADQVGFKVALSRALSQWYITQDTNLRRTSL